MKTELKQPESNLKPLFNKSFISPIGELEGIFKKRVKFFHAESDESLVEIEKVFNNQDRMCKDAVELKMLLQSSTRAIRSRYQIEKLKEMLIVDFQNFYPARKFEMNLQEVQFINTDKSLFDRAIKKLISLGVILSRNELPVLSISKEKLYFEIKGFHPSKADFKAMKLGWLNDSEDGELESISLRMNLIKELFKRCGHRFQLLKRNEGGLRAVIDFCEKSNKKEES